MRTIVEHVLDISENTMVARCLHGEKDAWESLFCRYQPRLVAIIKSYLGRRAECGDLAEEIAASVWYSLIVGEKARLRRYDPARGTRLITYMAALARQEIRKRHRREQNRHSRETRVARRDATNGDDTRCDLLLQEFLETLTPREREFCLNYLLARCGDSEPPSVSACNAWQLRSRVMRKFRLFSGERSLTERDAV